MNKYLLGLSVFLVGCVSTGTLVDHSSAQNIVINDKDIKIAGQLLTPYKQNDITGSLEYTRHLIISFNQKVVIDGYLSSPEAIQGELDGVYDGKKVATVCSSLQTSQTNVKVDCMVLIDNKRTITLTF